jgi:hypothetical protein
MKDCLIALTNKFLPWQITVEITGCSAFPTIHIGYLASKIQKTIQKPESFHLRINAN